MPKIRKFAWRKIRHINFGNSRTLRWGKRAGIAYVLANMLFIPHMISLSILTNSSAERAKALTQSALRLIEPREVHTKAWSALGRLLEGKNFEALMITDPQHGDLELRIAWANSAFSAAIKKAGGCVVGLERPPSTNQHFEAARRGNSSALDFVSGHYVYNHASALAESLSLIKLIHNLQELGMTAYPIDVQLDTAPITERLFATDDTLSAQRLRELASANPRKQCPQIIIFGEGHFHPNDAKNFTALYGNKGIIVRPITYHSRWYSYIGKLFRFGGQVKADIEVDLVRGSARWVDGSRFKPKNLAP